MATGRSRCRKASAGAGGSSRGDLGPGDCHRSSSGSPRSEYLDIVVRGTLGGSARRIDHDDRSFADVGAPIRVGNVRRLDELRRPFVREVASVEALRARVDGLLFVTGSVAAAPATTTGTNAAAATPTTTVPPSPTSLGKGSVPADQGLSSLTAGAPSAIEFQRCLSSAMHAAGPTTSVQLVATAAFMGTPALVYVFQPSSSASTSGSPSTSGDAARSAVVVTAVDGCRILVTTTE